MASTNPFELLGDDDNDDPSQLIAKLPAAINKSPAGGVAAKPAAKLPPKRLPPTQAVQNDGQRGGGRFGDNGNSNGGANNGYYGGYNSRPSEDGDVDKSERRGGGGGYNGPRGGRRGGYTNGGNAEGGEGPRRVFERHSGTGRGNELKREGSGRGNWGTATDEVVVEPEEAEIEGEEKVDSEKKSVDDWKKAIEAEKKKMTLEEYEKVLEEKRKALVALKSEERKVGLDKDLAKMQLLSNKKSEDDIFVKLGSDKDKRKEVADKEDRAKKSLSINEFLKPAGRGRGRGRGPRGGENRVMDVVGPTIGSRGGGYAIEDVGQFPSLSVK